MYTEVLNLIQPVASVNRLLEKDVHINEMGELRNLNRIDANKLKVFDMLLWH